MISKKTFKITFGIMIISLLSLILTINARADSMLIEDGTMNKPYIIENVSDLLEFANEVNLGNTYENQYILQTENIDLSGIEWPSIGQFGSECYFLGTYDGGGHTIQHLSVATGGNNAFFGQLGGTVMNLGIDSGNIVGACVGGITSHSSTSKACIINCYNKASVQGARAGGIADNFNGSIINCWTDCELMSDDPESIGGIISYDVLFASNCFSIEDSGRSAVNHEGIQNISKEDINYENLVDMLNSGIYKVASSTGIKYDSLYFWAVSKDGNSIIFSDEKAHFEIKYVRAYLQNYIVKFFPYTLVILIWCMVFSIIQKTEVSAH